MSRHEEVIEAPMTLAQLVARWQALCADPTFEDVAGKIELTEWGEIYGRQGPLAVTALAVDTKSLFG